MLSLNQRSPEADVAAKGLIMVVEDDLNLLEGIQTVLELEHYEVISVENGKQALETLRACMKLPDLIVSDIMMPHMNGLELLREVRKERAWISHSVHFPDRAERETGYSPGQNARRGRLPDQTI